MSIDAWNPKQYEKFKEERKQPFYDLLSLIEKKPKMQIIDLGCGTGELTRELHQNLESFQTLGIDSSEKMLEQGSKYIVEGLRFAKQNIEDVSVLRSYDLVFSNAALHWISDHHAFFPRLFDEMSSNSQIAIQMPSNFDYPTHVIALQLAKELPFNKFIKARDNPGVISVEEYANLLYQHGFKKQHVRLQVYGHALESTISLVEWVKGSLLTFYEKKMPEDIFQQFLKEYKDRITFHFGLKSPFFLPFKRLLIWGKKV